LSDALSDWAKAYFKENGLGASTGAPRPSSHARLGFSGAERYFACAGSPNASEGLPDIVTPYAREGSAAHEMAASCLINDEDPATWGGREIDLGDGGPKIRVDDEMVESIQGYKELIAEETEYGFNPDVLFGVEVRGDIEKLDPEFFKIEPIFGTCDVWILRRKLKRLTIIDLKYGRGVLVLVEGKPQTRGYALMRLLADDLVNEEITEIELIIYQPRKHHKGGPTRREIISVDELMRWATEELLPKAKATRDPNAPRVAGDHCLFCRAAPHCDTLRRLNFETAVVLFNEPDVTPLAFQHEAPPPNTLTTDQLARILHVIPTMEAWVSSITRYAAGLANAGVKIASDDGMFSFKLVEGRGRRRWVHENDETKLALAWELGVPPEEMYQEPKLKSPAMIEGVLRAIHGRKWKRVAALLAGKGLTETPAGSLTLASEDDERIAVTGLGEGLFEKLDD